MGKAQKSAATKGSSARNEQPVFLPRDVIERVNAIIPAIQRERHGDRVTQKSAVNYLVNLGLAEMARKATQQR